MGDLDVGTVIEGDDAIAHEVAGEHADQAPRSSKPATPRAAGIAMLVAGIVLIVWGVMHLTNPMG